MPSLVGFRGDALTELLRTIRADETSLPVISTSPFQDAGRILIDGERIRYTSKTPTTFEGCTRGADLQEGGTLGAMHPGGARVYQDSPTLKGIIHDEVLVPQRSALALYEGAGIDLTLIDNAAQERSEVTIAFVPNYGFVPGTMLEGFSPFGKLIDVFPFTTAATVSRDGVFTSEFDAYWISGRLLMSAANAEVYFRVRAAGVDLSAGTPYTYSVISQSSSAGTVGTLFSNGNTILYVMSSAGVGVTWTDVRFDIIIDGPFLADETLYRADVVGRASAPFSLQQRGQGMVNNTTSYDGFTIFPSTGTATGTVRTRGLRSAL